MNTHNLTLVLISLILAAGCSQTPPHTPIDTSTKTDPTQLLAPSQETRQAALAKITADNATLQLQLERTLAEAIDKHIDDDSYLSPLHCACLAIGDLQVRTTEDTLLKIVDYSLDASTLPGGIFVGGDYFYPAAQALVAIRVDAKKVIWAIEAADNKKQVRLLTWILSERADDPEEALKMLENFRKKYGADENLNLAMKLLTDSSKELLSDATDAN